MTADTWSECDHLPNAVAFFYAPGLRRAIRPEATQVRKMRRQFGLALVWNFELHHSHFNRRSKIFNNSARNI